MKVFVHAVGQSPSIWDKTLEELEEQTLRPDLGEMIRAHGAGYGALYGAFSSYCGQVEGPLELCGQGQGAMLALHYALDHPERVSSLVLASGRCKSSLAAVLFQNGMFRIMPERSFRDSGLRKREIIRLCWSFGMQNFSGRLGELSCPTLILYGQLDEESRRQAALLCRGIPGAQADQIALSGREINREQPRALAVRLRRFYRSLQ